MRQSLIFALLAAVAFSISSRDVQAQGFPSVSLMVKSTKEVEDDLKFIVNLAGPKGVAQWPNIKAILPAFLGGIDANKPIRVDFIFVNGMDIRYVIPVAAGVAGENALIANIGGFAGDKRPKRLKKGYYRIKGPAFTGVVRIIGGYAIISSNPKLVPANFAGPLVPVDPLIKAGYDVGAIVKNTAVGMAARKQVMNGFRKQVEATLKKRDSESEKEFELRKVALGQQIDELERIFVESDQLMLGWTTDVEKREGRLHLELNALPDTDLEKSITALAAKPSLFAAMDRGKDTIFFGRINHALDKMRQDNIQELLKLLQAQAEAKLNESTQINHDDKDALREAAALYFDMLSAGTKMGVIDGFVNAELVEGKRVVTGGIRVADTADALQVLQALDKTEAKIVMNAVKLENGLDLHRVTFGETYGDDLRDLLGVTEFLVGFPSKDVILYAGGGKAEERIEAAVKALNGKQPANDGTFFETWVRAGAWVQILKDRRTRIEKDQKFDPEKLTPEERKKWEEDVQLREEALKAFATKNDTIHMKLQRQQNKVVGVTTFAEDLLKLVGLQIAKFSEKSLQ
ncbi:MAG: hypothetical protein H8E37_02195 [Planctomycetes bacterium]|nr:hypothetical protein [Planctomycetota bacterium]